MPYTHEYMNILMSIALGPENGSLGGKSVHTGCQNGWSEVKSACIRATKVINGKESA